MYTPKDRREAISEYLAGLGTPAGAATTPERADYAAPKNMVLVSSGTGKLGAEWKKLEPTLKLHALSGSPRVWPTEDVVLTPGTLLVLTADSLTERPS